MMRRSFQKPSSAAAASNVGSKCQKCLKDGHWTADCSNERVYKPRPSRTALLFNPKLKLPEASMVKDDFIDERQSMKNNKEPEFDEDEISEVIDADTFANQIIEEVKMTQKIQDRHSFEERNKEPKREESNSRDTRRRNISQSRSPPSCSRSGTRSRSPPRHRTRSHRSRSRTPEPVNRTQKIEKDKKYSEYASDSDFSSDSE